MREPTSPAAVFRRLVRAVAERRQSQIVDECYTEDVVVEHPFMVPEPTTIRGREQLRKRMTTLEKLPITMEIVDIVVHETSDAEVIVGEFESRMTSKRSGQCVTTGNIMVLRVRDGLIVSSRDYHNHALLAEFMRLA